MEKTMGYRGMHVVDSDTHYLGKFGVSPNI